MNIPCFNTQTIEIKEEDAVIALSNISTALYLLDKCQRNSTLGS